MAWAQADGSGLLSWRLRPLSLLRGRASADITAQGSVPLTGRVELGLHRMVLEQIQGGAYDNARVADKMLARAKQHVVEVEQRVAAIDRLRKDELGKASLSLKGHAESLPVSSAFQHRFRGM